MAKGLENSGYEIINNQNKADLCVINTCTVTNQSNSKCRKKIRSIQKKNPHAIIAVVGCFSQIASEQIIDIGGVHLVLGNAEKLKLHEYLGEVASATEPVIHVGKLSKSPFTIETIGQHLDSTRANLKVQDGCDFICSFCVIPSARGRSRPRTPENIREELQHLQESGVKEIVLTGVNIGTYQYEQADFIELLNIFEEFSGIERVRISSIEPTTVGTEIFEWMKNDSKLLPYLHLPLQSASDRILRKMRRRYSYAEYLNYITQAKKQVPNICIGSDVIVGFPGESDEVFEETFRSLQKAPIDYFHVFPYAERKGTTSEKILPKITPNDIQRRASVLRKLSDQKRQEFIDAAQGDSLKVLFEKQYENGIWQGYSENYIRVEVTSKENLKNQIKTVLIADSREGIAIGNIQ
ncbi:MAG: tRNA (N(6)-L-threonylcarbamoyladenosine(37)-C(2))-methylthiotransferase MtaB [Proteobacteria bacterium]|nr:tRNA (N(6)-L-threonylcarbamoyladenosine(37)-C(2))-methylthiotransferase MtaB [Pseudomonadota bacterium]